MPTPKRPRGRPKGSKNKGAAKTRVRLGGGVAMGKGWLIPSLPLCLGCGGGQWVRANGESRVMTEVLVLPGTMGKSSQKSYSIPGLEKGELGTVKGQAVPPAPGLRMLLLSWGPLDLGVGGREGQLPGGIRLPEKLFCFLFYFF